MLRNEIDTRGEGKRGLKIDTLLAADYVAIDEATCACIRKLTKNKRSEFFEVCHWPSRPAKPLIYKELAFW